MIDLRRRIDLAVPPRAVWERLWDIDALARCIPGCGDVESIEEHRHYRATIRERVGPFRIAIPLEIRVEAIPPERLTVAASGRDTALGSPVKIGLAVTLVGDDAGGTRLEVDGQAQIAGKLATLGQSVIQRKTRDALDQFAANLEALFEHGGERPRD